MQTDVRPTKISCRRLRSRVRMAYLKGRTAVRSAGCGARVRTAVESGLREPARGRAWTGIHPMACGWSRHPDLNRGPTVYETVALPTELCRPGRRALLLTTLRCDGQAAFPQRWAAR